MDSITLNIEIENAILELKKDIAPFLISRRLREKGISVDEAHFILDNALHKLIIFYAKQRILRGFFTVTFSLILTYFLIQIDFKIYYLTMLFSFLGLSNIYNGYLDYKNEKKSFLVAQKVKKVWL